MTDIVERLRAYARNCGGPPEEYLTWQAAAEIERLTELQVVTAARAEMAQIDNERLRAALQDAIAWHETERGNEPGESPRIDGWRAALEPKP